MEVISEFRSRNAFTDDWSAGLQRIRNSQKLLFDDMGTFDIRLIRIGTLTLPQLLFSRNKAYEF
jgi:hypothetical protein